MSARPLVIAAAILSLCGVTGQGQIEKTESVMFGSPKMLQGIDGVQLTTFGTDAAKRIEDRIRVAAEGEIRRAGIPLLDKDEDLANHINHRILVVGALAFSVGDSWQYKVDGVLKDQVILLRSDHRRRIAFNVPTWTETEDGITKSDRLTEVEDAVRSITAKFCNDYLKANPKK